MATTSDATMTSSVVRTSDSKKVNDQYDQEKIDVIGLPSKAIGALDVIISYGEQYFISFFKHREVCVFLINY